MLVSGGTLTFDSSFSLVKEVRFKVVKSLSLRTGNYRDCEPSFSEWIGETRSKFLTLIVVM